MSAHRTALEGFEPFEYDAQGRLRCQGLALDELAERVGTPLYVYSAGALLERVQRYKAAFAWAPRLLLCYAVKANGHLALLRLLAREGLGADVVSRGELERALRAGIPPERVVFAGVGKRPDELERALCARIYQLNVESAEELSAIAAIAARLGVEAPVAFRVNLALELETHPHLATGTASSHFGLPLDEARALARLLPEGVRLVGVHTHLGSQITRLEPFVEAAQALIELAEALKAQGHPLRALDLGGGLGVAYRRSKDSKDSKDGMKQEGAVPGPEELGAALRPVLQGALEELELTLVLEPGRSLIAPAGALLTRVLYRKRVGGRWVVVVDAGMTELLRPALYGAHHEIVPTRLDAVAPSASPTEPVELDVVGPVCESGDVLGRRLRMPLPERGAVLAVLDAGAYGFVMSSNYNARPRPAEVLIDKGEARLIRPREPLERLWADETNGRPILRLESPKPEGS